MMDSVLDWTGGPSRLLGQELAQCADDTIATEERLHMDGWRSVPWP